MKARAVNLHQGTEEWLRWRKEGVGASELPIIMGVSKYMTSYELWKQKLGLGDKPVNQYIVNRGHVIEKAVKQRLPELGVSICIQDNDIDWMRASLDGYNEEDGTICEIKYVGFTKIKALFEGKPIPLDHYYQMQWQMLVSGFNECTYVAADVDSNDELIIFQEVVSADKDCQDKLLTSATEFWCHIETQNPPSQEKPKKDAIDCSDDDKYYELINEYIKLDQRFNEISAKKEEARLALLNYAEEKGKNCNGFGVSVTQHNRKGSINYKKIKELDGVDLEQYRGKESTYWKIEVKC